MKNQSFGIKQPYKVDTTLWSIQTSVISFGGISRLTSEKCSRVRNEILALSPDEIAGSLNTPLTIVSRMRIRHLHVGLYLSPVKRF